MMPFFFLTANPPLWKNVEFSPKSFPIMGFGPWILVTLYELSDRLMKTVFCHSLLFYILVIWMRMTPQTYTFTFLVPVKNCLGRVRRYGLARVYGAYWRKYVTRVGLPGFRCQYQEQFVSISSPVSLPPSLTIFLLSPCLPWFSMKSSQLCFKAEAWCLLPEVTLLMTTCKKYTIFSLN